MRCSIAWCDIWGHVKDSQEAFESLGVARWYEFLHSHEEVESCVGELSDIDGILDRTRQGICLIPSLTIFARRVECDGVQSIGECKDKSNDSQRKQLGEHYGLPGVLI